MRLLSTSAAAAALLLVLFGCGETTATEESSTNSDAGATATDGAASNADATTPSPEVTTTIVLGATISIDGTGDGVTIDGDVARITKGGSYGIRGTGAGQVLTVEAPGEDVVVVLDGVDMTNEGTPSILFADAASASVFVKSGTVNRLSGGNDTHDAALYSVPSLTIDGGGELHVVGGYQEGIATEMHLNIAGASTWITSFDDGLNANNDGVSVITISGGYLHIVAGGDGIDSNGAIAITGGTVVSASTLSSDPNTGLDADQGVTISGGVVIATGARSRGPSSANAGQARLTVSASVAAGTTLVATDATGSPVLAFETATAYEELVFSSPALARGQSYTLTSGAAVVGTAKDGLYTTIESATGGAALGTFTAN